MPHNQNSPVAQDHTTRSPQSLNARQPELPSLLMPHNQNSSVSQCYTFQNSQDSKCLANQTPTANRKCINCHTANQQSDDSLTEILMTLKQPTEISDDRYTANRRSVNNHSHQEFCPPSGGPHRQEVHIQTFPHGNHSLWLVTKHSESTTSRQQHLHPQWHSWMHAAFHFHG